MSKDADFVNTHLVSGKPSKLLVVKIGNSSNAELIGLIDRYLGEIVAAFADADYIELHRTLLVIHAGPPGVAAVFAHTFHTCQLGSLGTSLLCLCPLNPTTGSKGTASRREDEEEFVRRLEKRGGPVAVRDTRGREIDAACGQLAAELS